MKKPIDLFLDSGAFSAFTQDVEINLKDYIAFIKENQDLFRKRVATDHLF